MCKQTMIILCLSLIAPLFPACDRKAVAPVSVDVNSPANMFAQAHAQEARIKNWGTVFVTYDYTSSQPRKISLKQENLDQYVLPKFFAFEYPGLDVNVIMTEDQNNDGFEDIVIIATCRTEEKSQEQFLAAGIYINDKRQAFRNDPARDRALSARLKGLEDINKNFPAILKAVQEAVAQR
jgi:hypothetical protein